MAKYLVKVEVIYTEEIEVEAASERDASGIVYNKMLWVYDGHPHIEIGEIELINNQ